MGSAPSNPSKSCWEIKEVFPEKKSGFYWLKPRCTNLPIRVFCDFDHKDSQYYYY